MSPARRIPLALVLSLPLLARTGHAAPWSYHVVRGALEDAHGRWVAGDSGAVVALDDRVTLELRAGTILRVDRKPASLKLDGGSRVRTYLVDLVSGTLDVEDPMPARDARQAVLVHAPRDISGTTLGGHMIVATVTSRLTVANLGGVTWVGVGAAWHALGAGTAWSSSKAILSPYPLAPAPVLDGARHAWSGVTAPAAIDGLRWSSIDGALRYVVQLESPDDPDPLDAMETTSTAQPRPFRAVSQGRYAARVAAVDANGIAGAPSAPLALSVIGVGLPPGSYIAEDDSIRIAEHEVVLLEHAEGFVASYGQSQGFIAAPPVVKLFRGERTVVRLRDPRDAQAFDLLLSPRRVALRVLAGPKSVEWPGEPVEITIDSADGALPDSVEVHPVVTLGVDRVPLEFQKVGRKLRAELPAPRNAGPGPWVVRVDVADQFGHFLGRDFVEVGMRAHSPLLAPLAPSKAHAAPAARRTDLGGRTHDAS